MTEPTQDQLDAWYEYDWVNGERDGVFCTVCGEPFTAEEWEERHTAPDGSDIHAGCCQECNP